MLNLRKLLHVQRGSTAARLFKANTSKLVSILGYNFVPWVGSKTAASQYCYSFLDDWSVEDETHAVTSDLL